MRSSSKAAHEQRALANKLEPSPKWAHLELASRKPSRIDELLSTRKVHIERSKMPRMDSLADAPHEIVSPPATAVPSSKSPDGKGSAKDFTIKACAAIQSSSARVEGTSLEQYAGQSCEDRLAALDDFMVENLENPAFTTLCEDVENCWRRFALGL